MEFFNSAIKFFRLWLSLWVPVSAFGVLSICWKLRQR